MPVPEGLVKIGSRGLEFENIDHLVGVAPLKVPGELFRSAAAAALDNHGPGTGVSCRAPRRMRVADVVAGAEGFLQLRKVGRFSGVKGAGDLVQVVPDAPELTEKLAQCHVVGGRAALGAGSGIAKGGGAHEGGDRKAGFIGLGGDGVEFLVGAADEADCCRAAVCRCPPCRLLSRWRAPQWPARSRGGTGPWSVQPDWLVQVQEGYSWSWVQGARKPLVRSRRNGLVVVAEARPPLRDSYSPVARGAGVVKTPALGDATGDEVTPLPSRAVIPHMACKAR